MNPILDSKFVMVYVYVGVVVTMAATVVIATVDVMAGHRP